jgi:serine protease Do
VKIYRPLLVSVTLVCFHLSPIFGQQEKQTGIPDLNYLSRQIEVLTASINPAVVEIFATTYSASMAGSTTSNLLTKQRSTGSGVILSSDGYCVTNAHVVQDARRILVTLAIPSRENMPMTSILSARGKMVTAELIGVDRETDLAVIKLDAVDLPFLRLGNSDDLRQGQLVLAIGSPLGLQNSVSMGVISSVARQLEAESPMVYIQTDAPINPGNSGGPLLDTNGQVIGINTMIMTQSGGNEGLGFAVPANIVDYVYRQILKHGRVRRGEIGVKTQTITPLISSGLNLTQKWGVIISDVTPGSPAETAGLRIGDIIESMDDKSMENGRQFDVNIYRRAVGEIVVLKILRESTSQNIRVRVIERENDDFKFADLVTPQENLVPELGVLAIDLTAQVQQMLPMLRVRSGILIAARAAEGVHWEGSLMPGDVIHSINNHFTPSLNELRSHLSDLKDHDPMVFQVERAGSMLYVAMEYEEK